MKSKSFFKKALSVCMAALVSASTVFPVYAADLDGVKPVTETDAVQTDSEGKETEVQQTEASVTEALEATKADGDENTDANDQYALCLPRTEGVEYTYDEEHLDSEFSDQLSMYVLVYDENEKVDMTVKTDKEVSIVDGYSGDVFLSSDSIVDGKISFNMPATDLVLLPNEELETEQTESESAAVEQSESETETQSETETLSEAETQTETEVQSEIQSETQSETESNKVAETEAESETETEVQEETELSPEDCELVDEKEMSKLLLPEAESTVYDSNQNVYFKDNGFDYKSYVPDTEGVENANVTWEKGEINFDANETYDIIYKAVLKDDESYFWYIDVPMSVVPSRDAATIGSDGFENKIFMESSEEFPGVIPEKIGDHVSGPDLETVKGENFSLLDVNLGYDMDTFTYKVEKDDNFNSEKVGTYNISYLVRCWQDPTIEFYVNCKLTVKDSVEDEKPVTVYVKSTELKSVVTDIDGNVSEASYGKNVSTDKKLKEIVVKPAWKGYEDIKPVISVMKKGTETDKKGIIESETKEGNNLIVKVDPDLQIGSDKYIFVVDYPTYIRKDGKGNERRTDDWVGSIDTYEEEIADANAENGIELMAAKNTQKSKSWAVSSSYLTCTGLWGDRHVYVNGVATSQVCSSGGEFAFTSTFRAQLNKFMDKYGVVTSKEIPSSISLTCADGNHERLGWTSSALHGGTINATLQVNSKGEYNALYISVYAYGADGSYQNFEGAIRVPVEAGTGDFKIVKSSLGKFAANVEGIHIQTTFKIYEDKNCTKRVGKISLSAGENKTSISKTFTDLDEGKYYVKETSRCAGHARNTKIYPITITAGKTTTLNVDNQPFFFRGNFLVKKDKSSKKPLAGAVFKVSAKRTGTGQNLGTWFMKTDANGEIKYDADHYLASWKGQKSSALYAYGVNGITYALPNSTSITAVEVEAPEGYVCDTKTYTTTIKNTDPGVLTAAEMSCDPIEVLEDENKGDIRIHKADSKLGSQTPNTTDYSLAGAKYSVLDASGTEVAVLTTKEDGYSDTVKLPCGKYSLVEKENPLGYKIDPEIHDITVSYGETATVEVKDDSETGSLNIHKKLDPEEPDAIKANHDLTKIEFTLSYQDNDKVEDIVVNPDANGYVHVDGLYFGTWLLEETNAPKYHEPMQPQLIVVSKDDTEAIEFEVENYRYKSQLEIWKKDLDTGKEVQRAGCTFQIKDEAGEYVSLDVDNSGNKVDTFVADEGGVLDIFEKIPAGKYTLIETVPPAGYKLADPVEFEVSGKEAKAVIEMHDKRVTTGISIEKKDTVSGNFAGAGFTFNVIADENITDAAGTTYKGFEAGATVDTLTTGEDGTAKSNVALYPGRYHIEETGTASNYNKDAENVSFEVVEKQTDDGWAAEVKGFDNGFISVKDTPVMRPIQITKTDADSQNAAGADFTFTITADKVVDGTGHDYEGFEHGTVVDTITTDGRGIATSKDLYCGTYIIKETVRKQNYVLSTKEYPVTVSDEDKTTEPVKVSISDQPLKKKIQVTKIDKVTGNHCGAGYQFQITAAEDILDGTGNVYEGYKAGDVVDTITTGEDGIAVSKELYMGSYNIQEIGVSADGGMSINETKYPFTLKDEKKDEKLEDIKDTDEVMVLPITDIADTPTTLKIKKVDALQDKDGNALLDENGQPKKDENDNQLDPKPLEGIIFRVKVKDAEDSDDQLYTTDKDGNIKVEYLKKNTTYTVKEYKTIPGYNLSDEVEEFTVDDKGQIEGSDIKELTFTNVPNQVAISKTDITNGNELPGAEMQLTDMDGNVLYSWTSGYKPHMIYGLPDGQYRLVEKAAPAVKDADGNLIIKTVDENGNEIHQYELATSVTQSEKEGEDVDGLNSEGIFTVKDSLVVQKVTMKDSPYRWVDLSKKTITGDDELPGCTLTVRDAQGDVVDTWVSTTEAHRIQLHSGVYTLTEEKPADGYVTAKSIDFTVIQTSDTDYAVQTVTMRDDVTKITVSKKDITNGEELPGAHLVIKNEKGDVVEEWTSTNETHYIEKLPIGKYTLTEITAPDGYETAETISFEIKDTGEIQHYEMFDSPYRPVEVSKKDITSKDELPGAKLEIRDKDNNVVDSWTSTSEAHKVDLPHGKYTLIETKPADGFTTAESIQFEVLERNTKEDNGVEVQHVEMEDDVTKVQISKQDVTTKKELPGAKLQIKDKDGKVIEEWTSTNEVHYIEKLPIGEYTLVETTAPNGYDVAESVDFKVLDTNEIQHVIMYDSPSVTPGSGTNTPKTGDINPAIPVAAGVAVVVLAGLGIFLFKGKKKKLNK